MKVKRRHVGSSQDVVRSLWRLSKRAVGPDCSGKDRVERDGGGNRETRWKVTPEIQGSGYGGGGRGDGEEFEMHF